VHIIPMTRHGSGGQAMEVVVMSLSEREQQALEAIEDRLTGSDPKLASLLATFTRLASGEEMPVREKIRAQWARPTRRWRRNRRDQRTSGLCQPACRRWRRLGWERVMLLLALTAVIAATAVTLIINGGGRKPGCAGPWASACAQQTPAHSSRPTASRSG
jgi:hypothetical protein